MSASPSQEPKTKAEEILHLDYSEKNTIWLQSQVVLRRLIGILGVLLPVLLWLFLFIDTGQVSPMDSISHYYFTRASSIFVIIVSLLAIFLLVYKGEEPKDFFVSAFAGLFALCLILFPTSNISDVCCDLQNRYSVTVLKVSPFRVAVHYVAAALFLLLLAGMALFLFTKSDKSPKARGVNKRRRNRVFRVCGVIMILAIIVVAMGLLGVIPEDVFNDYNLTFWMETVAIESFGVAWLIKGKVVIPD